MVSDRKDPPSGRSVEVQTVEQRAGHRRALLPPRLGLEIARVDGRQRQDRVDVLRAERLHVDLGQVGVDVLGEVVVADVFLVQRGAPVDGRAGRGSRRLPDKERNTIVSKGRFILRCYLI